jgi:hypothetical protein
MSKNFQQYIAESERVYKYRIKVAGDVPSNFFPDLKKKLEQFDIVKFGDTKSRPIQAKNMDFPAFDNEAVTSMDFECRYPAIEPQIKQLAQLMYLDPNRIIMTVPAHDDSMESEYEKIEKQNVGLLTDTDYPAPDSEQKDLSKDYSADPYEHSVLKNAYKSDFVVAGGKTPAAQTTNQLAQGNKSPMSDVKRPPRPQTGANKKG